MVPDVTKVLVITIALSYDQVKPLVVIYFGTPLFNLAWEALRGVVNMCVRL